MLHRINYPLPSLLIISICAGVLYKRSNDGEAGGGGRESGPGREGPEPFGGAHRHVYSAHFRSQRPQHWDIPQEHDTITRYIP